MKTKLIALLLALAVTASLTACGSREEASPAQSGAAASTGQAAGSSAVLPDASAEEEGLREPQDEPQPAPEGLSEQEREESWKPPAPVEKPAEKPAQKPVEKPAQGPAEEASSAVGSADAVGSAAESSVDLGAFYESQAAAFGENDFPAMTAVDGEALDAFYPGLSDLSPRQCLVYMPMISAVAAEFALVEVSSAEEAETVKSIFQSRADAQVEQGAFYPATIEAWQNNTRIVSNGNYVMLVCFDQCDTVVSSFNALF